MAFKLAAFFMLATVSSAARPNGMVRHVEVPDLLLDIYHMDIVSRCHLRKVAASLPIRFEREANNQLRLKYNVTAYAPHIAGHLVFQVDPSATTSAPCEPLQASLNDLSVTLRTFPVNTSLVAKVDHTRLNGTIEIRLKADQLAQCGVKTDEIFLLSNVDDRCDGWQQLMWSSSSRTARSVKVAKEKARSKNSSDEVQSGVSKAAMLADLINWPIEKRTSRRDTRTRSRCHRKDFVVSFQQLSYSPNFVSVPDKFNMGMCKGSCNTIQCKTNNAFLRGLINDMVLDKEMESKELPQPPACRPTKFDDLQVIVSQGDGFGFEVRVLANMIVTQCGCL